ncbi:TIGR00296 family protein [Methanothermococcus okinawensis]|uniref:Protein Metok_1137 n=1 Tax=Methanothermococcus okinawensis (strain DSM 14208 / JCM 11175 / IH1) TaxID=647113 RepID=F8ANW5_METOI|nr:TIGR00296 family protein [Methanothermococcus okinawensis]AEH07106.1 AMMECR1-domain protein [Methanothermococcus okinawensis IH1]
MEKLTLEEGTFAVKFARTVIENYLTGKDTTLCDFPEKFNEPRGVFVSLHTYPEHNLRGCIGIPEPVMPLIEALKEASISAAVSDPRFPPVSLSELDEIVIEVSILTVPKLIEVDDPTEYLEKIEIGRDGLIIEYGAYRGLLLPQVPVEFNWDVAQYLANLCLKAGMPPDTWLKRNVNIYSFQAQIFEEIKPNSQVVEKTMYSGCQ